MLDDAITAQRGLNGEEMLAIKSFANNCNSAEDLQKIANALKQTKKSDPRNSLLKLIDERIKRL